MNEANSQQSSSRFSDINEILRTLRRQKNVIIWTALICTVLTLFVSMFLISPKYSSSTDILVNRKMDNANLQNDQGQIQADIQMISTYKDVITSPTILNAVSNKLSEQGYHISAGDIRNCISISNQQNSQVFTVTVKTKNPRLSSVTANTIAEVFKTKVKQIMSVNNVTILSKAVVNQSPVSPKIGLNTLIGIIVGLILGLIFAFIANGMDRTITDESFITDVLKLNDLGIINEIPANKVRKMIAAGKKGSHSSSRRRV